MDLFSKIAKAYYGDGMAIDPAIIALIKQLFEALIANCPVNKVMWAVQHPVLSGLNRRIDNHVDATAWQSGETFDAGKVKKAMKLLAKDAKEADVKALKAS